MNTLVHLIYASTAASGFDNQDLILLLRRARESNAQIGVTGILLYIEGSFFQVLEGQQDAVEKQFAKIPADPRHSNVVTIIKEPIAKRAFGEWTMGFTEISFNDVKSMDGLNDFFGEGSVLEKLGSGRAKKLVAAFGQGSWRSRVCSVSKQTAA